MKSNDDCDELILNRRSFLSKLATGAGIVTGLGTTLSHSTCHAYSSYDRNSPGPGKPRVTESKSENDWLAIKKQFTLRPGLIALNAANLCPSSRTVSQKLFDRTKDIDGDPSFENRLKYENGKENTRHLLATMLGALPDEIAITRNTSESNRTIIAGLDLSPGDEVIVWDQNHESNNVAWDVWSKRRGFTVKRVTTPRSPQNDTQLLRPFADALGPRTKVVSFSHVSNLSGIRLPAQALCKTIRANGAVSLVDGAQTFGMSTVDLHNIGCDFYTGSAHKWLCGPRETGVLYIRRGLEDIVWPSVVTHDWEKAKHQGAQKFDNLGQRDDGRLDALGTAVEFYNSLDGKQVEARVRTHVEHLMNGLEPLTGKVQFLTPTRPELRAGIVAFLFNGKKALPVMRILYQDYGISAMAADIGKLTLVRFAPHIYNTPHEIDTAIKAVNSIVVQG